MQAFFGGFIFAPPKSLGKFCLELNNKEFNGVNLSSTRARTNVLASFNLKAGMNSQSLYKTQ